MPNPFLYMKLLSILINYAKIMTETNRMGGDNMNKKFKIFNQDDDNTNNQDSKIDDNDINNSIIHRGGKIFMTPKKKEEYVTKGFRIKKSMASKIEKYSNLSGYSQTEIVNELLEVAFTAINKSSMNIFGFC